MERKTGFELKQLDEKGQFIARIARLKAIDKDQDVTQPGAFGSGQVTPILVGHRWDTIALGKAKISEEGDEVLARGKLNLAMQAGRDLYESLRFDVANPPVKQEWSYGFSLVKSSFGEHDGRRVRFLEEIRVHEVSVVVAGAGDTALLAVKEDVATKIAELVAGYERLQQRGIALAALELLTRPAPGDGAHRYRLTALPPHDLRHRIVHEAAKAAAAELNIEPPKSVLFFTTAYSGDRVDFAMEQKVVGVNWPEKHAIGVHVVQGHEELVDSVRHEVGHLGGLSEGECERFARKGARLLGTAPRREAPLTWDQTTALLTAMRHAGMSRREIRRAF